MADKSVEQRPSETAMFAALHRALAHKNLGNLGFGPDHLAEHFLPPHFRFFLRYKKIRANIHNKIDRAMPGLFEYMIARTAWFDSLFKEALNNKIPQIVLLGAGYDSRGYRFASLNGATKIIELDTVTTQDSKKKYLSKAQTEIPNQITLVSINFNKESLENVLSKAGYENRKETLFLWEGVSYYLEPEAVDATLDFVSRSLHQKSRIAFDYTLQISDERMDSHYGVREFYETMKKQHGDESLMFAIDDVKIESFLEQRGLKMVDHFDNREIERSFLMNNDGSLLGQITGHFCFVLASPKPK